MEIRNKLHMGGRTHTGFVPGRRPEHTQKGDDEVMDWNRVRGGLGLQVDLHIVRVDLAYGGLSLCVDLAYW